MKRVALLLFAACGSSVEHPSKDPPPPWGVPISGGSMIVTRDGKFAVVADPDRDRIVSVDLATRAATEVALDAGDEPGRLVEDGAGRIHVALRGGGALFTLAKPTDTAGVRRAACAEPRGVAWHASTDLTHVACSTGELVSFAAAGEALRTVRVDRDLRDVIVDGDRLYVTRFRSAELLALDDSGAIAARLASPVVKRTVIDFDGPSCTDCIASPPLAPKIVDALPAVAWRAVALPGGGILVSHQRQVKAMMQTTPGGYGMGCGGPVEHAVTIMRPGQAPFAVERLLQGTLPVDVALAPNGQTIAFAMAGTSQVHQVSTARLSTPDPGEEDDECDDRGDSSIHDDLGFPTSVAYTPDGQLAIYYPQSPAIVLHPSRQVIALPGTFGYDSGRALFHRQTSSGLACASCHPEGRDDGLVWEFENIGVRRTQSLGGSLLARAPYHWNGDMVDLDQLVHDVFVDRMGAGGVTRSEKLSLGPWLDRIPAPRAPLVDGAAAERGRALFESAEVGCASCHNGALLTNNQLFDVGTGGKLKVPSLVGVGARAPFMHDGCAATLRDRFGACGGGDAHGKTSGLTEAQLSDLVAYLESL